MRVRNAASRLFRQNGYHATTMDDIAASVGLKKATLYHYYGAKSDILFEIFADCIAAAHSVLPELDDLTPPEAIRRFLQHQIDTINDRRDQVAVYYQESRYIKGYVTPAQYAAIRDGETAVIRALAAVVSQGTATGIFRDLDPVIVSQGIIGMCAWVPSWWKPADKVTIQAIAAVYADQVLHGIGN